jgi:hypothetical protein
LDFKKKICKNLQRDLGGKKSTVRHLFDLVKRGVGRQFVLVIANDHTFVSRQLSKD